MSKNKGFRDWLEEEDFEQQKKFKKQDGKRYDKKKAAIQRARKQKNKQKNSYFS
jgi:hypothetical protein